MVGPPVWAYEPYKRKNPPLDGVSEAHRGVLLGKLVGLYGHSLDFICRMYCGSSGGLEDHGVCDELISERTDKSLYRRIDKQEFDYVIIGFVPGRPESEAEVPYINAILEKYERRRIMWIETDDRGYASPQGWHKAAKRSGLMFVRELDDEYSCQG